MKKNIFTLLAGLPALGLSAQSDYTQQLRAADSLAALQDYPAAYERYQLAKAKADDEGRAVDLRLAVLFHQAAVRKQDAAIRLAEAQALLKQTAIKKAHWIFDSRSARFAVADAQYQPLSDFIYTEPQPFAPDGRAIAKLNDKLFFVDEQGKTISSGFDFCLPIVDKIGYVVRNNGVWQHWDYALKVVNDSLTQPQEKSYRRLEKPSTQTSYKPLVLEELTLKQLDSLIQLGWTDESVLRMAMQKLEAAQGKQNDAYVNYLNTLARATYKVNYFNELVAIHEKMLGANSLAYSQKLFEYANTYIYPSNDSFVENALLRCLDIRKAALPRSDKRYYEVVLALENHYTKVNNLDKKDAYHTERLVLEVFNSPARNYYIKNEKDKQYSTFYLADYTNKSRAWAKTDSSRWALVDSNLQVLTPFAFDEAFDFVNGKAARVRIDSLWGLVDMNGKWIAQPRFYWIDPMKGGMGWANLDKKWGLMAADGKWLIEPNLVISSCDTAKEYTPSGVLCQLDALYPFRKGLAWVKTKDKWGLMNSKGAYVLAPQFDFVHKDFLIEVDWDLAEMLDSLPFTLVCNGKVPYNSNNSYDSYTSSDSCLCGLIDDNGKWLEPLQAGLTLDKRISLIGDKHYYTKKGKAQDEWESHVLIDNKWVNAGSCIGCYLDFVRNGLMQSHGVFESKPDTNSLITQTTTILKNYDNSFSLRLTDKQHYTRGSRGFRDIVARQHEIAYGYLGYIKNATLGIEIGDSVGLIGKDGFVLPPIYQSIKEETFALGLNWLKHDGKWGAMNNNGDLVIPFRYDAIRPCTNPDSYSQEASDNEYVWVLSGNKWALMNMQGLLVIPAIVDDIAQVVNDLNWVKIGEFYFVVNRKGELL